MCQAASSSSSVFEMVFIINSLFIFIRVGNVGLLLVQILHVHIIIL